MLDALPDNADEVVYSTETDKVYPAHGFNRLDVYKRQRLLNLCRLCHHIVIDSLRNRKMELIGCLDVCNFLEQGHQLRQVEELGKPCPCAIAGALGSQFNRRCGLTESGSPAVKMLSLIHI